MELKIVKDILEANQLIAEQNRALLSSHGIYTINLMSSPGAGKTSLIERTVDALKEKWSIGIIEGDIATTLDSERILSHGVPAVQINTGGACHLDGNMIRSALSEFSLDQLNLLIVENVGNLVCPAEFTLGVDDNIMILSTPEGADKPAKYPLMFQQSTLLVVNKVDLLPHLDFDIETLKREALRVNPKLEIIPVSCKDGQGLEQWCTWLETRISHKALPS